MFLCVECQESLPYEAFSKFVGVSYSSRRCDNCLKADTKTCNKCGAKKALEDFSKGTGFLGRKASCKVCIQSVYDPRKQQNANLVRLYGITVEEYDRMLALQNGVCGVCNRECPSGRRLAVDHNHSTGKVRGLLCTDCNRAIGLFKDDPDRLRRAADYLERND